MGYDRNDCWMTCGARDDKCAALGIEDPFTEIDRLRTALIDMQHAAIYLAGALANPKLKDAALNKLESALAGKRSAP